MQSIVGQINETGWDPYGEFIYIDISSFKEMPESPTQFNVNELVDHLGVDILSLVPYDVNTKIYFSNNSYMEVFKSSNPDILSGITLHNSRGETVMTRYGGPYLSLYLVLDPPDTDTATTWGIIYRTIYDPEVLNWAGNADPPSAVHDFFSPLDIEDIEDEEAISGGGGLPPVVVQEAIPFPPLPNVGAINTGFVTLYRPTGSQLSSLSNYLWSSSFADTMKKMFVNPMDAILGVTILPIGMSSIVTPSEYEISVAGIGSGVSSKRVYQQYVDLNLGQVKIQPFRGTARDYDSTSVQIYLPFIGMQQLNIQEVMDSTLELRYHVDVLTGSFVAMLRVKREREHLGSVLYQWPGQMGYQIPISGADWSGLYMTGLSIGASLVGLGLSMGTGAGKAALKASVAGGTIGATAGQVGSQVAGASPSDFGPNVGHTGAMGGTMLGVVQPYILLERPQLHLPEGMGQLYGYKSGITRQLSRCSGFTQVREVHVEGISGTDAERDEIERLLKEGIVL